MLFNAKVPFSIVCPVVAVATLIVAGTAVISTGTAKERCAVLPPSVKVAEDEAPAAGVPLTVA